jgi:hypothetical protein
VGDSRASLHSAIEGLLHELEGSEPQHTDCCDHVEKLRSLFQLSPFETRLLLLCASYALTPRAAAKIGGAPTFSYALAHLPDAHIDAAAATSPLRYRRLVSLGPGPTLEAELSLDERVLSYMLGIPTIDERLLPYRIASQPLDVLTSSQAQVSDRLARQLASVRHLPTTMQLHGGDADSRLAVLQAAAGRQGLTVLRLRSSSLVMPAHELELVHCLVEREVLLGDVLLTIEIDSFDGPEVARAIRSFVAGLSVPVVISAHEPIVLARPSIMTCGVPAMTHAERHELWMTELGDRGVSLGRDLDRLAHQFHLEPTQIADVARLLGHDQGVTFEEIWAACREATRPRLDDLGRRIEPVATWESLVLPAPALASLQELVDQLEFRHQVHERWGFARGQERGQALTALFHGPSGTGKTHAAEVIASAANLDLFHIDLSQVVDKYVGETEKRLRRIFDAAEHGGAVLLFDEADALFGKRGNIERATDRWANLEVSYLLQRMERYHGLAILTTNAKQALDPAFLRRLQFVVQFPFPEIALRAELWRRVFPSDAPVGNIEPGKLARFQLTGANIRSVATKAAFRAAHDRTAITMSHILAATRSEFAKLGVPFPEHDAQGLGTAG